MENVARSSGFLHPIQETRGRGVLRGAEGPDHDGLSLMLDEDRLE